MTKRGRRKEPRWLTESILLAIHAEQIERYGGSHGVLDKNVVLSALARPMNRWAYDSASDLADLAGTYLVAFAGSQGFNDGNKRTGLACALVFLATNGARIHAPPAELYTLTMAVATHRADDAAVATYIRSRLGAA